ncbi:TPA: hypothetical protein HA361_04845 [Candidatus Woesearchaeota archaeon]|nr:hypothetical protein [Candidatus Woesearchaeota archaeon]HII68450.1 hypothetical protein [Candidatus Woesearchaeota archaeon]
MPSYDLELEKAIACVKEKGYKTVLIQLPDGLKPRAKEIVDALRKETGAEVLVWLGACYGACDIPHGLSQLGVELLVQWGHNVFRKKSTGW